MTSRKKNTDAETTKDTEAVILPEKLEVEAPSIAEASKDTEKTVVQPETVVKPKIYIGPNMVQLTTYTVFSNGLPFHVEDLIKKCPSVGRLIVSIEDLAQAEGKSRTKGSKEYRHYRDVIKFLNGEREGDR